MNEEKIPDEAEKANEREEAATGTEATVNERTEDESKQRLSQRIVTEESPTNDIPKMKTRVPSALNPRDSQADDDDEPLNEISSVRASPLYNTDDIEEGFEFDEEEWYSEELWNSLKDKAEKARLSLYDPKDETAAELKIEDATLKFSKLPRLNPLEEQTSAERIFNLKIFSDISLDSLDTEDSFEAEKKETTEKEKLTQEDFFEKLGPVPEVKDVGSGSLLSGDFQPRHYIKAAKHIHGQFVDPLTGASLTDAIYEETKEEIAPETSMAAEEAAEEEQETELSEFEFDDFDVLFPEDAKAVVQHKSAEENADLMDIFTARLSQGRLEFNEMLETEIDEKQQEHIRTGKTVEQFLDDLIKFVVFFLEQKEGDQYLREKLDKKKVFYEIESAVKEFLVERSVQSFLNRKIENYYRRKRQLRNLTPERPEILAQEKEKYREAVESLDQALGREVYTTKKTNSKIDALFIECDEAEKMEKVARQQFNDLLRKTFKRENMPRLEALVEVELEHIAAVAKEVSQVRAVFISRQHMLGTLRAQLDELENIGNGLRVADYENIERETMRLEKKIEEHNTDLERFFLRFRNTIHTMAHSKIRNEMLINCVKQQVKQMSILDEEQNRCHLHVFHLKKKRQQIQRQISDLSFQCGLLDKPAMLIDYDCTIELVKKKRSEVEHLRESFKHAEEKLRRIEAACHQG